MKFHKMMCMLLSASMLSLSLVAVNADSDNAISVSSSRENNVVTVKILTQSEETKNYSITVLNPGASGLTDNGAVDGETFAINGIYNVGMVSGSNEITYSFTMSDSDATGKYTVLVGCDNIKEGSKTTSYYLKTNLLPEEIAAVFAEMNKPETTFARFSEIIESYNDKIWALDLTDSAYITDKDKILNVMYSERSGNTYNAEKDVVDKFNLGKIYVDLSNSTKANVASNLGMYSAKLNCTIPDGFTNDAVGYAEAFCNLKADVAKYPLNGIEDLKKLLNDAEALAKINSADRETITTVLGNYATLLGIDMNGSYAQVSAYEVAKAMESENFSSLTAVTSFFNTKVNSLLNGGGSGGGNSGGSGGGGGGGIVTSGKITQADIQDVRDEKSVIFDDVAENFWAKPFIDYLSYKKVMVGDGEKTFRPQEKITREEFVTLLMKTVSFEPVTVKAADFEDINDEAWYFSSINLAVANNICNGISETKFGIGNCITRQDAITMIYNTKKTLKVALPRTDKEFDFADKEIISEYAKEAIDDLCRSDIVSGYAEDNTFRPQGELTRAEAAKIIYSFIIATEGKGGEV